MRIAMEKVIEDGRTVGMAVNMTCRNEEEFLKSFERIADIDGVEWCGCPTEEETYYWDTIAYIPKNGYTVAELHDEVRRIAKECKQALRQ